MLSSVSLLSYFDVHFGVERSCSFLFYTGLPNETPACTHRFFVQPFCLIKYLIAATFSVKLIIRIKKGVSDKT
jgi:hypothetical protein